MSVGIYFLMTRGHSILGSFDNLSDARTRLHVTVAAQYVARLDGVVLAFMSREGHSWRVISKVPSEFRESLYAYANIKPGKGEEVEPDEAEVELYPPPVDAAIEAAFDL
jgi:hypothetical protein